MLSLIGAVACGSDIEENTNKAGAVGWKFAYHNWTKSICPENPADCVEEDFRLCDNLPSWPLGTTIPPYDAITEVRVELVDPDGTATNLDRVYPCGDGAAGKRVALQGLAPKVFDLTISARTAAGDVVYRLTDLTMDLVVKEERTFEIPTIVGELKFTPLYEGGADPLLCPDIVENIHIAFADQTSGDIVYQSTLPACDIVATPGGTQRESRAQFLRNIPSNPATGDTYTMYNMTIEALDAGGTPVQCASDTRAVSPGGNVGSIYNANPNLTVAACP